MKSEDLGLPIEYQLYPEYFDIPSNSYHTDKKNEAIEKILRKYGSKNIVDLACGTGAQVLYLKKLGYEVLGCDFSPGLLNIARTKALKQNIVAQFNEGDMRHSHMGEFDAVITIDNAIGHLIKQDFEIALKNIYQNLKSGGIYVFDILNLEAMTDEIVEADSKKMTTESITSEGDLLQCKRKSTIDRLNGILTSDEEIIIQKNGNIKQIQNRCSLQIYTSEDLNKLLSKNGFKVIEQHKIDAYTFNLDEEGYSLLTVAEK